MRNLSNKMKIVFIISNLKRTGPVNQLYQLLSLMGKNHTVSSIQVIAIGDNSGVKNSMLMDFKSVGIDVKHLGIKGYNLYKISKELKREFQDFDFDIIVSQGFRSDCAIAFFPIDGFKNKLSILHNYIGPDYLFEYGGLIGRLMTVMHKIALKKFHMVISVSESVREYVRDVYSLETIAIKNGVVANKKIKEVKRNDLIKCVYVGNIDDRKNVIKLLHIFQQLSNVTLDIYGDGPRKNEYEKLYSSERIRFCGYINNVQDVLSDYEIFVSASTFEGLPMAVLEALASGLPCILSDISPHKEILSLSGKFGMLDSFTDPHKLNEKINRCVLLKPKEILKDFSAELSSDVMCQRYLSLFKKISDK
ncbi:glycosyltransferase family 4 protein [Citrobacter freundii]|nr:glycosyltransferase family 4 protein [Citrobacter freundii]MBE0055588.1 glycosyltransferase family 4 protein [Citrobacter freundii]